MGSNPILSTIFSIESAPGNNRFLSCSSSFLYADVRKAENAALSLVRIPRCHGAVAQDSRRFHDCFHALARIELPISGNLAPVLTCTGPYYMSIAVAADPRLRTSRSQDPMVDRFAAPMPI